MRYWFCAFIFFLAACTPDSEARLKDGPRGDYSSFDPFEDAVTEGYLLDDVVVNIGYECTGGSERYAAYTLVTDPRFVCPTDSSGVSFFLGTLGGDDPATPDVIENEVPARIYLGSVTFTEGIIVQTYVLTIADLVSSGTFFEKGTPEYANVARLLQSLDLQPVDGLTSQPVDEGFSWKRIVIPDEAHAIAAQMASSWSLSMYAQDYEPTDVFAADTRVTDFLSAVQAALPDVTLESLAYEGDLLDAATALARADQAALLMRSGVYAMQIFEIPELTEDLSQYIQADGTAYVDRSGNMFGFGLYTVVEYINGQATSTLATESFYFMDTVANVPQLAGLDITDGEALQIDGHFALKMKGDVNDQNDPVFSQYEASGRFVNDIMFATQTQVDTLLGEDNGLVLSSTDFGSYEALNVDMLPGGHTGPISIEKSGLTTPELPYEQWLDDADALEFPAHFKVDTYRTAYTWEANLNLSPTNGALLLDTFYVTLLEDGNIVTDRDGDCDLVDPATLLDQGGQQEYPTGFVSRLIEDPNGDWVARILLARTLPETEPFDIDVPSMRFFGAEMSADMKLSDLVVRASDQTDDGKAPAWQDLLHFFLQIPRIDPGPGATDEELAEFIAFQNVGRFTMLPNPSCP